VTSRSEPRTGGRRPAVALAILIALAVLVAAATATSLGAWKAAPPFNSHLAPAAKPTVAQQRALHARVVAAERRRRQHRARAATVTILAPDFAIFRRAARAGDAAPNARSGDESRKAFTRPATSSRPAVDVYVIARQDDICVIGRGGSACGPASQATTKPVVFGIASVDGTGTELYGPVADDVVDVEVTGQSGIQATVQPTDNAFALDFADAVASIRLRHRDGRVVQIVS
jgi:hypothetical protein